MTSFKAFLPNETRRFKLKSEEYSELEKYLCEILSVQKPIASHYRVTYFDDEQEIIRLTNNEELHDAIHLANGTAVKIYISPLNEEPPSYTHFNSIDSSSSSLNSPQNLNPGNSSPPSSSYSPPSNTFPLSSENNSNFVLPPQFAFLSQYFYFTPNNTTSSNNGSFTQNTTTTSNSPNEGTPYQFGINELQDIIFFMIVMSARLSSRLVGGRVSLNEETSRNLFNSVFQRIVAAIRIRRSSIGRSPFFLIKRIIKIAVFMSLVKIIATPLCYSFISTATFFISALSTLVWFFFPIFLLISCTALFLSRH